jgi:hypothetical protein
VNPATHPSADPHTPTAPGGIAPAADIDAIVLLAGEVRLSKLSRTAKRSRLDLPIRAAHTVADRWIANLAPLRQRSANTPIPLIVATNSVPPPPRINQSQTGVTLLHDRNEPRGSGGSLRDLAQDFPPDARLLVASAFMSGAPDWNSILPALARSAADVAIHTDLRSVPSGIYLIRCRALAEIPTVGFIDLKEQAMPQIAARHDVRVIATDSPPAPQILSLDGYINAARLAISQHDLQPSDPPIPPPFAIVEDGAIVDPSARLHDAVVLAGARVGANAIVARSLIGPDGIVPPRGRAIDRLVDAPETSR